jgi:hypothetical protein
VIRPLLSNSEAKFRRWRDALQEALGPNGQLIMDLVPELRLIIGEQPPVPDLPPQDAQGRFQLVFRRFIGVFARAEHPLALFRSWGYPDVGPSHQRKEQITGQALLACFEPLELGTASCWSATITSVPSTRPGGGLAMI